MNRKVFFASLLIFSLIPVAARACNPGDASSVAYMWRDNNRCEGIASRSEVSGSFDLISFATGSIANFGDTFTLKVPVTDDSKPTVTVEAPDQRYRLDNFSLNRDESQFTFNWSTYVLKRAKITPAELRATAVLDSEVVYIPVILGQPSGKYEFVFFSPTRTAFSTVEILRASDNKVVYSYPRTNARAGEVNFSWDGRNAPKGRYILRMVGEIEQRGTAPEKVTIRLPFEHDPNWLK